MIDGFRLSWRHFFHVTIPAAFLVLVAVVSHQLPVHAAAYTWDGGGSTNNWSEGANWSPDAASGGPGSADTVTFNATSTKNVTMDATWSGSVTSITIASGYTGIITQSRSVSVSGTFSQADGTFTGGSAAMTVSGAFTLSGGAFTATSGTMTIASNFTHSGGTFAHNNGTFSIASSSFTSYTYNSASTLSFYNFTTASMSNSGFWTLSNDTINVENNLTFGNNGSFDSGTFALTNSSAASRTITQASGFGGGTATVSVGGTDTFAITLTSGSTSLFPVLTLNNANAAVTVSGTSGSVTVRSATLTAGTVTGPASGGTLKFSSNATTTLQGATITGGAGTVQFDGAFSFTSGTVNGGSGALTFAGTYTQTGGTFTGSNGTVTHTGAWALTTGTYTATSGTTAFAGNITHNSGTFNHNNGTVSIASSSFTTYTYNSASTLSFYNFSTAALTNSGSWTLSNDTLNVENNLTFGTSGSFDSGTFALTNTSGRSRTVTQGAAFGGGTAVVSIGGTDTIAITLTSGSSSLFPTLTLNNPNAAVTVSGTTSTVTVRSATLTSGTVTGPASGGTLKFSSNATTTLQGATITGGAGTIQFDGAFSFTSGTYTGGSGTTTFAGTYTQSGGTMTDGTGIIAFGSTFTHTAGGTMTHDSGTVQFTGTATGDVATTETFYNLTFPNAATHTISSGDTYVVTNTLTLTDGAINTGTLNPQGNVSIASTYDGGTSPMLFSGTANQSLTLGSAAVFDGDVTVNKASGTVTLASAFTLNAASQDLILTSGTFDLAGFTLIVNGTSSTMTVANGATVRLQGGETVTTNTGYPTFATGGIAYYYGTSSAYTLKSWTYSDLTMNGGSSTVWSAGATLTMRNLTVSAGTFAVAGNTLTVTGTVSNDATIRLIGSELLTMTNDTDSGTVTVVGDGDAAADTYGIPNIGGFYNLTVAFTDSADVLDPTSDNTLDNSLVAYWNFDEGSGSSAADSSGNGYTGTLTNMEAGDWTSSDKPTLQSTNAYALDFDGTNEYITFGNPANLPSAASARTVCLWAKTDTTSAAYRWAFAYGTATTGQAFALGLNGTSLIGAGYSADITGTSYWTTGVWKHLCYTYNGTTGNIYSNGSSSASATGAQTLNTTKSKTYAGRQVNDSEYWDGRLDEIRVYSRVLAAAEIASLGAGYITNSTTISSVDINGDLLVSSGTLTMPAAATIAGNITRSGGTLTMTSTALTLDGTNQTISASPTVASLSKTSAGGRTLTLTSGNTVTVTGATSLTGTSSGSRLAIVSSTPSSPATLDMQGAKTLQYLSVTDNTATTAATCFTGCADGGRNTNWSFAATFVVAEAGGTTDVTEGSGTDTFTVALNAQPAANVTVTATGTSQVAVDSGASLVFTNVNWATPQTVTVSAVNDAIDETSPAASSVSLLASSSDPVFDQLGGSVTVNVTDNDTAGVTVTESSGTTAVTEGGATDSYTVVLTSQPTADVTVTPTPDADGSVSPSSLTFTSVNWATPQTVTVTAVNDSLVEGAHTATISNVVSSSDPFYNAFAAASVVAAVTDNDTAGFVIDESGGVAVTEGSWDLYTIVLTAQPTANVVITPAGNADVSVSPSTLTFTSGNWSTPQTVTVTGTEDSLDEPSPESVVITHTASSGDGNYNNGDVGGVTVQVTDATATPSIAVADATVSEGGTSVTVTVTMTGQSQSTVSVNYATSSGSATQGTDFTSSSGTLSWTTTQTGAKTFDIPIAEDALDEDDETIVVTLSSVTNATLSDDTGSVTITDNDATPSVTFSPATAEVQELDGESVITVTLSAVSGRDVTIPFALAGTAAEGDDYTITESPMVIAKGDTTATITVLVQNDFAEEERETVLVLMGTPTNASQGATTLHTVTIIDDDQKGGGVTVYPTDSPGEGSAVALITPNGGRRYLPRETIPIEWLYVGRVDAVDLSWSPDGGTTWHYITKGYGGLTTFSWNPPPEAISETMYVKVEATDLVEVYATDTSDAAFAVGNEPPPPPPPAPPPPPPPELPAEAVSPITGLLEATTPVTPGSVVRGIVFPMVYRVTDTLTRRIFLNIGILRTYGLAPADVQTVTDATITAMEIAPPMPPKPGTVLVKTVEDPRVYFLAAAEDGSPLLRWIPSEFIAGAFFGGKWADYVIDIPKALFDTWALGAPLGIGDAVDLTLLRRRVELFAP